MKREALNDSPVGAGFAPVAHDRTLKRERILGAGLSLFAKAPYQSVTMDSVAAEAGVAKGTLYLYFESKEDLYLGILSDGLETIARNYQASVNPAASVSDRLRRAIEITLEFYDQRRDLLRLMATEEPRMAEARNRLIDDWRERGVRFFTSLIEEGASAGAFRANDPLLATWAILGAMRSVMLYYGPRRPISEITAELSAQMLRSLAPESSNGNRKASQHT
jgi:TetR/AcrR family fatty acid metabolism transcriptional regulator